MSDKDVTEMTKRELVDAYAEQVERAVRAMWSRCIATMTIDDMRALGFEGLLQAHDRYDPEADTDFAGFARSRIRGAMIDGRRRSDWGPRTRETSCHDNNPSEKLQEATRMDSPEVLSTVTAGKHEMPAVQVMFVEPAEFSQLNLATRQHQDDRMTRRQLESLVSEAMEQLGDIERAVVRLHDIENKTLSEVADEMECSKSWAAKLRERALGEIEEYVRETMTDRETDGDGERVVEFPALKAA